jgi:cellulose synthase/poly-beta-1,6-N-acetylglucosamine synthase-like glycosyltransferase
MILLENRNLVSCSNCGAKIGLGEKSIRYRGKWLHAHCLGLLEEQQKIQQPRSRVYKTKILTAYTYTPTKPVAQKPAEKKPSIVPQRLSDIQLEVTLQKPVIVSKPAVTQQKLIPTKIQPKKAQKVRPDPVLIALAAMIFGLLVYVAHSVAGFISLVAIGFAAVIAFYNITSKKHPQAVYQYKKKGASFYSMAILLMPFVFGTILAADGYFTLMTLVQAVFVWSLALSFWQTMLFVPLAIRSVTREKQWKDPEQHPKISVIVPAYNEEKVIRTTIEALLATDYPDKEIILVDDGSKDRTLDIAMQYKDRIKVIHKENGGKASALNQGLLYCTAEIVVIVDADTIIGNSSLKAIARGMAQKNVAAVAGNIKIRNRINLLTWCQALEYLSGIQIMRRGLDYFGAITIVPGALGAFLKAKLVEAGTYHKETLVEDFDATMKVLRSGMVVNASNTATAYTQAPPTLRDYYKQRKRWYRGNLQVLRRHSDILMNPRFGYLQRLAYPLMAIHMLLIPAASLMMWSFVVYMVIIGDYYFVLWSLTMFIILQYLLSAMAVRMEGDDKKMILYSVFLVIGYKQIIDFLQLKAVFEELLGQKAKWTSAQRTRQ